MDLDVLDEHYSSMLEPNKSLFLFLRDYLLKMDGMDERYRYKLPFFYYKNKPFCYFHKTKENKPYIGFNRANQVEHDALAQENRKKMKVLYLNPNEDIEIDVLNEILDLLKKLYK